MVKGLEFRGQGLRVEGSEVQGSGVRVVAQQKDSETRTTNPESWTVGVISGA